ncbi:carbohydrate kinase family protein [Halorubrum ezzemoulense]|uniref:Carbohydrate kinase family protein n=1 Tax=Halorubrum ezzemoulense TaxID=337243 RepID=A0A256IY86_HALEZ|nr:carbohydrate kinase family protein [Halorubrum ezzemoulense]MDB2225202.1 carbohydrate kinase family protein [Halorubrum ezzemoulense]MDB9247904.1 carbohydrate kinase family protein [Halorubrum ezzemoulense]MDB9258187.1 carbohydrate kinase family protein [Halorubrum ezzemoulense]MDB9261451.1 carbohydrate kinase family protein [Halorubrum ezzemoulense]MDB9264954.1 carbohydrate kinase family protein [Halorubrum ezzemoulense]
MTAESDASDGGSGGSPAVLCVGAAAIDEWYAVSNLPEPDGGAFAREVTSAFGGVGANVAVALDRLGRDAGLVSRVGDDEYGRRALEYLGETGVDGTHVAVGDDAHTRSLILRDPDGERAIVTAGESFRGLRLDGDALAAMADADAVFLTAYTPDSVARRALDRVRSLREAAESGESGSDPPALVFDLSGSVEELVGRGTEPATVYRFLHEADLFVADGVAAPAFFGSADAAVKRVASAHTRAAESAPSPGPESRSRGGPTWPRAVLTHGADGMTAIAGGEVSEFDAFDVETVDATGAGDAFTAGLIDRWIAGAPAGPSADRDGVAGGVRFAAAIAAINCTSRFTQPGLPTRSEVEAFLADRGVDVGR